MELALRGPGEITAGNPTAQLMTIGTLVDATLVDLTASSTGTFYLASNPTVASISAYGFVTAFSSGNAVFTATHEGIIASIGIALNLTQDSDGDGMPDDFEELNATNPGGANLARLPGVTVNASSHSGNSVAERVIDGSLFTSWFAGFGDAANRRSAPFIDLELPFDVNVAQLRLLGNRSNPSGFDFFAGRFQAFDQFGHRM